MSDDLPQFILQERKRIDQEVFFDYLCPDLVNLVLDYRYPKNPTFKSLIEYQCIDILRKCKYQNWNEGLKSACSGGYMEIVQLMIEKGATDWNNGLFWACRGGHMEIVQLLIEKGATDWNCGLMGACFNGHMEIVQLIIEKGATYWEWGLIGACRGGHMEIIQLMIEKGATNWVL